jgi:hypothetical protein
MSAIIVLLLLLAAIALWAIIGTFVTVIRDGRGHTPEEPSESPWAPGQLPSRPYTSLHF